MRYTKHFSTRETPQGERVLGKKQVMNSAGGYVFAVDKWARLERFLILGSEGGTYYVDEKELTVDNATTVMECIAEDGTRVVDTVVAISKAGRAPSNDPALFVLAMCAGTEDDATRKYALSALPLVARIGTHLFHFAEYVRAFRGYGRGLRGAMSSWYNDKEPDALAYQVVKYQQRDGWSHRDILRLAHPVPATPEHDRIFEWVTSGECAEPPALIRAYEEMKSATRERDVVRLILEHGLTREMVPTTFLNSVTVWDALLQNMPLMAMIRNLGKMTSVGLIKPFSVASQVVQARLLDIGRTRVHPLSVLVAMRTYVGGRGIRGSLQWRPDSSVVDALDEAFHLSFGNVVPTGKRICLALDVSGSMTRSVSGMPISCREASAAMAMVTARVEQQHFFISFQDRVLPLAISPRQRLDDVIRQISHLPFGRTDCAQPMLYSLGNGIEADAFIVLTDNETWHGKIHPFQALKKYRELTGIPAKLAVVAMTPTRFSIADPDDAGMMDVVGFDTATPNVISDFVGG